MRQSLVGLFRDPYKGGTLCQEGTFGVDKGILYEKNVIILVATVFGRESIPVCIYIYICI